MICADVAKEFVERWYVFESKSISLRMFVEDTTEKFRACEDYPRPERKIELTRSEFERAYDKNLKDFPIEKAIMIEELFGVEP
jgi:hypothetical protein